MQKDYSGKGAMYNLYIDVVDGCWRRTLIGQPKDLRIVSYDSLGIICQVLFQVKFFQTTLFHLLCSSTKWFFVQSLTEKNEL